MSHYAFSAHGFRSTIWGKSRLTRFRTSGFIDRQETLCSWLFLHFRASYITVFHGVWQGFVPKLVLIFGKPSRRRMILCLELGGRSNESEAIYTSALKLGSRSVRIVGYGVHLSSISSIGLDRFVGRKKDGGEDLHWLSQAVLTHQPALTAQRQPLRWPQRPTSFPCHS
jgi:hypothetical protein